MQPMTKPKTNFPETMEHKWYGEWVDGQYQPGVAERAVKIWRQLSKDRLPVLLRLGAPDMILWNEMARFKPGRVPVASKPQYDLLEEWKNELVTQEWKQGQMYMFQTAKGVIGFNPKGRFGPYFKVI
jgi:hypothetical protein